MAEDLFSITNIEVNIKSDIRNGNLSVTGEAFDFTEYQSAIFILFLSNATGGETSFYLEHSDDQNFTTYETVPDESIIGEYDIIYGPSLPVINKIGYVGNKRYIRAVLVQADMIGHNATAGILVVADSPNSSR